MRTALVFPGQGAQRVGMGKDIYENSSIAREMFQRAGECTGIDFETLIFEGPEATLMQTVNLQPAITLINLTTWEILRKETDNISLAYVLGHSLGEISAIYAAGSLDFESTLQLVMQRGRYMQEAAENNPGSMLAVLRISSDELQALIKESGQEIDIANYNGLEQTIISGQKEEIEQFRLFLQEHGVKKTLPLKVSGPWHSRHMESAQRKFADYLKNIRIQDARIPVISNITARPSISGKEITENLIQQITGSVHWTESIQYLTNKEIMHYIECGPGNILSGLINRINGSLQTYSVNSYEAIHSLKQQLH